MRLPRPDGLGVFLSGLFERPCQAGEASRSAGLFIGARQTPQGAEVLMMAPAEQDKFFNQERKRWAEVVEQTGIRID